MAEPEGPLTPDVVSDLDSLGFLVSKDAHITCYFMGDRLTTIAATGLSGHDPFGRVAKLFGHGKTVQRTNDIREVEWRTKGRRLRISELDGAFELILSEASR